MMTHSFAFYVLLMVQLFHLIQLTECTQCTNNCTFEGLHINSSLSPNFCSSSNSNADENQECILQLYIDFFTGFINGSFGANNRPVINESRLEMTTIFALNDSSISVDIKYSCSTSDYCDIEFLRETLSPWFNTTPMESFRQKLATRLFNPNNTDPFQCLTNDTCTQNDSVCSMIYSHMVSDSGFETIGSECSTLVRQPTVEWIVVYQSYVFIGLIEVGTYQCNTPHCGYNETVLDVFRTLAREYILPVNVSILVPTTPSSMTTPLSTSHSTPQNHGTYLFGCTYISALCFVIVSFLTSLFNS